MCRTLEFAQPLQDHALTGHVFKKISMETEEKCQLNCYLENDCVSYNYGFSLISNKHICELSESDHRQHPADLQLKHGFLYGANKVRYVRRVLVGGKFWRSQLQVLFSNYGEDL